MKLRQNIYGFLAAALISMLASACFTGIESTPKITADKVKEKGAGVTEEQIFAAAIVPQAPASWLPGKQWLVTDSKIGLTLTPPSDAADNLRGKILTFVEAVPALTVTGGNTVELVLSDEAGRIFRHRTGIDTDDWDTKTSYSIPFTVELSAVELADSLMRGKTFFITTPRWYDADGRDVVGLRHVPVTVAKVLPGNHNYPLMVAFTQTGRPDAPQSYVMMTYGTETSANRNFDRLFALVDPRKNFPNITDATWQLIINSKVAEGMTRDECRLALGVPYTVERGATTAAQLERWSYENGIYLLFEDGILTKFRM